MNDDYRDLGEHFERIRMIPIRTETEKDFGGYLGFRGRFWQRFKNRLTVV